MNKPKYITAGILVRRAIRRYLIAQGIDFKEEKGWIDSVFFLYCSDETLTKIYNDLKYYEKNKKES